MLGIPKSLLLLQSFSLAGPPALLQAHVSVLAPINWTRAYSLAEFFLEREAPTYDMAFKMLSTSPPFFQSQSSFSDLISLQWDVTLS